MNEKYCVPHQTDTLLGSYLFKPTCLFVETLPGLFILPFFSFFKITKKKKKKHSPHFTAYYSFFMRLFCKLSSSGSSDPYHIGGTRFVLSWETIVHYPRYKLRGQIRLKDTTLFHWARVNILICLFLYCCFRFVFSISGMRTNTTTVFSMTSFFS